MQRVRLRFMRGEEQKFVGHLDLARLWERTMRRAHVPLAYSAGHTPHPRIAMAAPLPVGVTSECELMDIVLQRPMAPLALVQAINGALPAGLQALDAWDVPVALPSLQASVRFAEYEVALAPDGVTGGPQDAIAAFLASNEVPWEQRRNGEVRRYDLRRLVHSIWIESQREETLVLGMRLRQDGEGAGRAEQVTAALGFSEPPLSVHRRRLILEPQEQAGRGWPLCSATH
jgi:radical SAM-linked protein